MKLILSIVVSALALCSADIVKEGVCPQLVAVENFNVTAYTGVWYEISKYPIDAGIKGACATTEYVLAPETTHQNDQVPALTESTELSTNDSCDGQNIIVRNSHVNGNVQAKLEGSARLAPDANGTARLLVTFKFGDVTKESPLWVLGTDYSSYAVAFACRYNENFNNHKIYSWIMSRTKTLEGDAKKAVDDIVKSVSDLDSTKFIQTDFSEQACKFDKSTVITEPPKSQ